MSRLPWIKFYPKDWRSDVGLQACSLAARGCWVEMMILCHQCDPYGHLCVNGRAINDRELAAQIGTTEIELAGCLRELESAGVFSRTEDGVIYSRRMVRDSEDRARRSVAGRRGGNPSLVNRVVNQPVDQIDAGVVNLSLPSDLCPLSSNPDQDPVPTTQSAQAVALLQHYHDQMVARHGRRPAVAFGGKDHAVALVLLRGRTLDEAKAIVDAYLGLTGEVARRAWPWSWITSRAAELSTVEPAGDAFEGVTRG